MNEPGTSVQNLVKKFGSFTANDNLNFEVFRGESFWFSRGKRGRKDNCPSDSVRFVGTNFRNSNSSRN